MREKSRPEHAKSGTRKSRLKELAICPDTSRIRTNLRELLTPGIA